MKLQRIFSIKPREKILIVTDKKKLNIAKKFYKECKNHSENVKIVLKPVGRYHGEEPPKTIVKEMLKYDIILAPTTFSLTHTKARINACKKGVRIATMPGITERMFKALSTDPRELEKYAKKLVKALKDKKFVRIKTKNGTDITFSIAKREIDPDTANIRKKGSHGNLPAGEVSLSPLEESANGVIVIDSMEDYVKPKTKVVVFGGFVVEISDNKCKLAKIFKKIKNSKNIAEFGIGMNKKAKLINNILQDEKVYGTCHIAFGNNVSYGGKIYSKVHLDCILKKPTIEVDGKIILENGVWKI